MTSVNESWSYGGTTLNSAAWLVRMLSPDEQVPGRTGENVALPNRAGRLYRDKVFDQRVVSLAMVAYGSGGTALWSALNTLKAVIGAPGQQALVRVVPGGTLTIQAEVSNVVDFQPLSHLAYNAVVEFVCADPYWTGAPYSVASSSIASSPHTFAVVNAGTAANERATITIDGQITNPKLAVGSIWVQYTGTVAAGESLVINCSTWTAALDGTDVTGSITHSGAVAWMRFLHGSNTVTLTGSSLSTPSVTVAFTELWL